VRSEYLEWVKNRAPARFNLASSGVTPYPLSELGVRIEDLEINGPNFYGYEPLQQAIARHCGVPAECVVATSGASMANFISMAALIRPGDEVLVEQPAYEPLLALARYFGAVVKRFRRPERPSADVTHRTRLIVITNLHNPSCEAMSDSELQQLVSLANSSGAYLLVDEVYLECMFEKKQSSFQEGGKIVCTSSLTKAYGLGGLRCGWIVAPPDLARRMWGIKGLVDPSGTHPAELLSVIAFQKLDRIANRARTILETNRAMLIAFLRSCPRIELRMPDYGTCVFPRIGVPTPEHFPELLQNRYETAIVPGRFFEAPGFFRIGIGTETETLAGGLERLQAALQTVM
jgi:aspartate/methionine/tyrosine aminotransferase